MSVSTVAVALMPLLAGCGQKGPLTLPPAKPNSANTTAPAAAATPAASAPTPVPAR